MIDNLPEDVITRKIIGAAIEVHRHLGPGLLESTYQACLAREMNHRQLRVEEQKHVALLYRGLVLDCGYKLDFLVEGHVVVELKAASELADIHRAQLLTYLKLTGCRVGLLINFNAVVLKDGLRRVINSPDG